MDVPFLRDHLLKRLLPFIELLFDSCQNHMGILVLLFPPGAGGDPGCPRGPHSQQGGWGSHHCPSAVSIHLPAQTLSRRVGGPAATGGLSAFMWSLALPMEVLTHHRLKIVYRARLPLLGPFSRESRVLLVVFFNLLYLFLSSAVSISGLLASPGRDEAERTCSSSLPCPSLDREARGCVPCFPPRRGFLVGRAHAAQSSWRTWREG